jgi:hypothetical protein
MANDVAYSSSVLPDLHEAVSAWFLGPQGENKELLKSLFADAVEAQCDLRLNFHNEDGVGPFLPQDYHSLTDLLNGCRSL